MELHCFSILFWCKEKSIEEVDDLVDFLVAYKSGTFIFFPGNLLL